MVDGGVGSGFDVGPRETGIAKMKAKWDLEQGLWVGSSEVGGRQGPLRSRLAVNESKRGSASLQERQEVLEAYVEQEVGHTPLMRARHTERAFGLRRLYVKWEGGNPTGTHKDRIAFAHVKDALRRGFDTVSAATCGNYGRSLAKASAMAGLRCVLYVPLGYHSKVLGLLERAGAELVRVQGDYERAVEVSQREAHKAGHYDCNPGGDNLALQLEAYGQIAVELVEELRMAPAVVALPVSNGTALAGVYEGFLQLQREGRIFRMPRLVAGSSFRKNPIVRAYNHGLARCEDLAPEAIRETRANEPLVNWHSIDGDHALEALRETHGWARDVTDREMQQARRFLREEEGWRVMPAATAGLVALRKGHAEYALEEDRYVAILTGRDL